ncbi:MAG TPA: hypothetical protein VGL28_08260 [Steroidobacteraceae bacterium]
MKGAFAEIAAPARTALEQAVKPVIEQFLGLAKRTQQMEATARRAMTWFSSKWIALTAAGFIGMSAMAWASVWWQRQQVNELTEQKTALEADMAAMQVNGSMRQSLPRKGRASRSASAGGRLCIVASKNQEPSVSDWHGPWNNAQTGQTFVIPNGYLKTMNFKHGHGGLAARWGRCGGTCRA